jgi:hypothetical protein
MGVRLPSRAPFGCLQLPRRRKFNFNRGHRCYYFQYLAARMDDRRDLSRWPAVGCLFALPVTMISQDKPQATPAARAAVCP